MSSLDTQTFDSFCWNLSNRCNMNCRFCFRELNEEELTLEENLKILDYIASNGLNGNKINKITFAGGEPLIYYGIKELIKAAHEKGFICSVVTNGYSLNESNMDEILPYLDRITFSCDSTNEYYNEQIGREERNYKFDTEVEESSKHIFDLIPKIREKYDDDKLKITINTLVLKDLNKQYSNLDDVSNTIYSKLLNYKIAKWKLLRFYALRGSAIKNKIEFDVPNDDFERISDYYSSMDSEILPIKVSNYDDIDNNLIVSPNGLLKKSSLGKEDIICDLKQKADMLGGGRHV